MIVLLPLDRSHTAKALPVASTATLAPVAAPPAAERVVGADHDPLKGRKALCTTLPAPGLYSQTAVTFPKGSTVIFGKVEKNPVVGEIVTGVDQLPFKGRVEALIKGMGEKEIVLHTAVALPDASTTT